MGKIRRSKFRYMVNKGFPFDICKYEMDAETPTTDAVIEAIRDQLQSANIEEKLIGLQSLAVFTANKDKVASMCTTDIVRIAGPLLCDKCDSVRNATAGALRNLSVCGFKVCDFLVEQDIMTPLLALLTEYALDSVWKPTFDMEMLGQMDLHSDVFLQAINLLWNLCESSMEAVEALNQANLFPLLIRCLDYKVFGVDIAISVAQTLLVITEDNPKSWDMINDNALCFLNLLRSQGDYSNYYLRTMVAGTLANVPLLASSYSKSILQALSVVLDENHRNALDNLRKLPTPDTKIQTPEIEVKMETTDDESEEAAAKRRRLEELPNKFDIAVRDVAYLLDAQKLAAEVITNLFVAFEKEDNAECETEDMYYNEADRIPLDLTEAIRELRIVDKLWRLAKFLDIWNSSYPPGDLDITLRTKVKNLRMSSILCLQNLCNCLSVEEFGGEESLYNAWVDLGQQTFKCTKDDALLEPLTSLMRSTLEQLKTNKQLFNQLTRSDLELMLDGLQNCDLAEIRANWLRMLGTLGCLVSEDLVKLIITVILETCFKENDVWTISEALDALMDMFAENDWPQLVADLKLSVALKQLQTIFKNKIRSQRKELHLRYAAVDTVSMNLDRFIEYIENIQ